MHETQITCVLPGDIMSGEEPGAAHYVHVSRKFRVTVHAQSEGNGGGPTLSEHTHGHALSLVESAPLTSSGSTRSDTVSLKRTRRLPPNVIDRFEGQKGLLVVEEAFAAIVGELYVTRVHTNSVFGTSLNAHAAETAAREVQLIYDGELLD